MRCLSFATLILIFALPLQNLVGQNRYPANYFRSPIDFSVSLSGSFGEIRKNHFHSGIDIRTQGVQGKPVYAVADGYVARVLVSPWGFGRAIYVAHPNGYTTVYGHLRSFNGKLSSWVRAQQYKDESFALDAEVPAGLIKVKKGDIIAYSGNAGSSAGPHLHFEVRDSKTQEAIDPLLFGLMKPDGTFPKIASIKIYPGDEEALVNGKREPLLAPVTGTGNNYRLKNPDTIKVSGKIYFGIETSDQAEGGFKTGINAINLTVDEAPVFSQNIDRFAFSETRFANSLMDYPAFIRTKHKIQRSFVAPNNKLGVYQGVKNQGVAQFTDSKVHTIRYRVTDDFGHSSTLIFLVRSLPSKSAPVSGMNSGRVAQNFTWRKDNHFERAGIKLDVPGEALYEDLPFTWYNTSPLHGSFADVHHIHDPLTPLHTYCTLSIKTGNMPKALQSKAIIVSVEGAGRFVSMGGKFENGWVTARIRDFGNYTVAADTISPVIRPINIFNNKKVGKQKSIQIKISDNLSGIQTYKGTLNGKWILMEFDAKNNLLVYTFDDRIISGKNRFVLVVTDAVGNSSRYEALLIR